MKKTIGVVFGGRSVEHDVSIITAHNPIIDSVLASGKYNVVPIYISKQGKWYSDHLMNNIDFFRHDLDQKLASLKTLSLDLNNGLTLVESKTFGKREIKIDLIFPAMHGTYGEDGSLMGLLRMANVPFVGCDLAASAVAMDKVLTKQVVENAGIKVVPYIWFTKSDFDKNKDDVLNKIESLSYPLFVKPVHLGSSIGISKVKSESELLNALEVALHYDEKVLVEEGVQNLIEVTLPIMGNSDPRVASIEKPLNKTDFFDFSDKYLNQGKKVGGVNTNYSEIPANISKELSDKVIEYGIATYKVLGCSGIARVDFLIDSQSGDVFVNEVNTLPGSLYQHNWKQSGVSNIELVETLIKYAEERFESLSKENFVFNSSILEGYKGSKN